MTSSQTRRHLRSLLDQLSELHLELQEIRKCSLSPETRRLFADTLEQCLSVHRLIVASIRTAIVRESHSENPADRHVSHAKSSADYRELRA